MVLLYSEASYSSNEGLKLFNTLKRNHPWKKLPPTQKKARIENKEFKKKYKSIFNMFLNFYYTKGPDNERKYIYSSNKDYQITPLNA